MGKLIIALPSSLTDSTALTVPTAGARVFQAAFQVQNWFITGRNRGAQVSSLR